MTLNTVPMGNGSLQLVKFYGKVTMEYLFQLHIQYWPVIALDRPNWGMTQSHLYGVLKSFVEAVRFLRRRDFLGSSVTLRVFVLSYSFQAPTGHSPTPDNWTVSFGHGCWPGLAASNFVFPSLFASVRFSLNSLISRTIFRSNGNIMMNLVSTLLGQK